MKALSLFPLFPVLSLRGKTNLRSDDDGVELSHEGAHSMQQHEFNSCHVVCLAKPGESAESPRGGTHVDAKHVGPHFKCEGIQNDPKWMIQNEI